MLSLTVEKKSWMHGLSVPLKLASLCIVTLLMLPVIDPWIAIGPGIAVTALYLSAGVDFARLGAGRLKPMMWLLLILFGYYVLTGRTGQGLAVCLKLLTTVGFANLVTMTSRLDDMMAVVEWLTKPLHHFGLPPRAFGLAMGLVIRFTPVFLQKGKILGEAWRSRSAKKSSPRLIVPLALGALDDADRVGEALRARGGLAKRTQTEQ